MLNQADQSFAEKTAKVVVVDSSSAGRHILSELVKSFGFQQVQGAASAKDVLSLMEVEAVDWILMPLCADQPVNALQLLKLAMQFAQLRGLRITLFVEDHELDSLPYAFELGLLSWIPKPYNKESLRGELQALFVHYDAHSWNSTLTAATYLRRYLKDVNQYTALLRLEEALVASAPGRPELLLHVAEAQFLRQDSAAGLRILGQVCLLDAGLEPAAKELARTYLVSEQLQAVGLPGSGVNVLGLESCVIVDPDGSIQKGLCNLLREIGIARVEVFNDGEAACQWLKSNPEPAVIFHEWRIPKVKGPVFIQRVRQLQYFDVAMIVVSSLIQQQDLPIIREMGVANIIPKPIERNRLVSTLVATVQQDRAPSEHKYLERRIRMLLAGGKMAEATELKIRHFRDHQVSEGKRAHIEAEFAYAAGDYVACRDQAIIALKQAGDSVLLLNLLGKAFMRVRDFQNALKCFEKAQTLSPMNITRLFDIAEVQSELGNTSKANDSLASARALDPTNQLLPEKQAQCAISNGETQAAHKLMQQMESVDNIVAYLNNRAVALARCGRLPDSVELYRRSLAALPGKFSDPRAILHYNLGLAYAKRQELPEAAQQLSLACQSAPARVQAKALSLKRRVDQALKHNVPFRLNTQGDDEVSEAITMLEGGANAQANDAAAGTLRVGQPLTPTMGREQGRVAGQGDVLASLQVRRGDICCHLLFTCPPDARSTPAERLAATVPRFYPREVIEREETFGLDKINARE